MSDLLAEWEALRGTLSRAQFAKTHGLTKSQLHNKLFREGKKRVNPPAGKDDTSEQVNVTQDGAYTELESKSRRIKTLDDLVQVCKIDLSKFAVERWTANKWEVGISDKNGGVIVEPLFQVKATLLPKHPDMVHLSIQPIAVDSKPRSLPARKPAAGRGLVLPDTQIGFRKHQASGRLDPFHDRQAMDVALQIAQDHAYDQIAFLGDTLDFNDWSDKFLKEAEFYFTTQPAIIEAHWWLSQFRQARPKARITKLEGNHENRMPRMLLTHLLAAYGLTNAVNVQAPTMSVETLLDLRGLGIEYLSGYPTNEDWMGGVRLIHGDTARNAPTETVKAVSAHAEETVIQGHIHKIEWASRTIKSRQGIRTVAAFSPGCLCRVDYVVPGHHAPQQWQQGACEVEWDGDDYQITPIVIQHGRAVHKGKVYKARDALAAINKDTAGVRDGWTF